MTIDINKKYKTREGKEARILATDGPGKWPVVGIVGELVRRWAPDGSHPSGPGHDLVEVPKEYFRTFVIPGAQSFTLRDGGPVHYGEFKLGAYVEESAAALRARFAGNTGAYQYIAVLNEQGSIIRVEEF